MHPFAEYIRAEKNKLMKQIKEIAKNIIYTSDLDYDKRKHLLDVYPSDQSESDVLIFIHGGGWTGGSKDLYSSLGKNFSKKGITTVINNYRLAPDADFEQMASDCAAVVSWVCKNIHNFNGNKQRIFISGHSAGGHLAALISLNPEFLEAAGASNVIKGCILIDAFGLNAKDFIEAHQKIYIEQIKLIFTESPKNWQRGSPSEFLKENEIPFFIFTGERTHDVLMYDNQIFVNRLSELNKNYIHKICPGKTHMQMIIQLDERNNELYEEIINFIRRNNN